ncbi:MAG: transporter substrate-binding domain-containing protein, partial [Leptolyngbyaceae cyanobacterium MO_188.B28]|nr:transporter substrate-binding domain-containing protein [Leptolyngbyaceae cyanobacterium MO_188.B28]
GLRAAVIGAAANADVDGWTLLDALRQFPTRTIDIKVSDLWELRKALTVYFSYNQAVVRAIQLQADAETAAQASVNPAGLPDLSQPGPYQFLRDTITITNPTLGQTAAGLSVNYDFAVNAYIPQGLNQPAPIVIISHGFGATREDFTFLAEHLVSYGIAVLLPEHVGSNLDYRQEYLGGRLNTLLSPIEFLDRPREISFLIDELEQFVKNSPDWANRFNLDQIGVMGDSLGGSTALALSGAEINHARLRKSCETDSLMLNFALYLACRARFLPPQNYSLGDPRIKAAIVAHPVGSSLYGPEGLSQVNIPLLMVAGSDDIVSPVVTEQIHPFVWIRSEPKYLALLTVGTHFTSKPPGEGSNNFWSFLAGEHRDVGTQYLKMLNVAFWQAHLQGREEALSYLTASNGQAASEGNPLTLDIIRSLTPEQLTESYGRQPPIPIIPDPVTAIPPPRTEQVRTEIKHTGVLKIAMRRDAAPFGYINADSQWTGYCGNFAIALRDHLTKELDIPLGVELVELPSSSENRFSLVQNGQVHLECGPNTIGQDVEGVVFSNPFSVSGARFLIREGEQTLVNPNTSLENIQLAVLPGTSTEQFVRSQYPEATIIPFEGALGRAEAVKALIKGDIDAFASDGILSAGEVLRQNLSPENYTFLPDFPLTCQFYGLVLPAGDPDWQNTVNQFLASEASLRVSDQWFSNVFQGQLDQLDYCLNQ